MELRQRVGVATKLERVCSIDLADLHLNCVMCFIKRNARQCWIIQGISTRLFDSSRGIVEIDRRLMGASSTLQYAGLSQSLNL